MCELRDGVCGCMYREVRARLSVLCPQLPRDNIQFARKPPDFVWGRSSTRLLWSSSRLLLRPPPSSSSSSFLLLLLLFLLLLLLFSLFLSLFLSFSARPNDRWFSPLSFTLSHNNAINIPYRDLFTLSTKLIDKWPFFLKMNFIDFIRFISFEYIRNSNKVL